MRFCVAAPDMPTYGIALLGLLAWAGFALLALHLGSEAHG